MRIEPRRCIRRAVLALSSLAVLAGCPGTLADKDRYFVDGMFVWGDLATIATVPDGGRGDGGSDAAMSDPCGDVPARLFVPGCGGNGCHGAMAPQNGLDLVSPGIGQRVVGKPATGCVATLADPKNPESSLIYTKLLPNPPCGAQMPLARAPFSNADIACVRAWIAAQ